MRLYSAVLLLSLLAPPGQAAAPDALEVLRESLEPPAKPYTAELEVSRFDVPGRQGVARRMKVGFSPPDLYRREILGPKGEMVHLIVQDGRSEWIYDEPRGKVWQGEPADPLYKRFGPDEEFERLSRNYDVSSTTAGPVAGRAVWLLELRARANGALRRRFWVDKKDFLVLQSEAFRPDGSLASSMRYTRLEAGGKQSPELFRFSPPRGLVVSRRV